MKKILSFVIILMLTLTSCAAIKVGKSEQVCTYTGDKTLSYMADIDDNGGYAFIYVSPETGEYSVYSAKEDGKEEKLLYTAKKNSYIYELYGNDGIIAFFERTLYSNNDERCTLKVIDSQAEKVYTPYEKVIVYSKNDIQSRFICVEGKDVYYVTASYALGESRVMKYTVGDDEPSELAVVQFTENEMTFGHSITCISKSGDNIIMACVDGYTNCIAFVNTKTGVCEKKKMLPNNVGIVYSAAYDAETESIALHYSSVNDKGEFICDNVGYISMQGETITTVYQLKDDEGICRESVEAFGGVLFFNVQNGQAKDGDSLATTGQLYTGYVFNMKSAKGVLFEKSFRTWANGEFIYNLGLDESGAYIALFKTEISDVK